MLELGRPLNCRLVLVGFDCTVAFTKGLEKWSQVFLLIKSLIFAWALKAVLFFLFSNVIDFILICYVIFGNFIG